jgi:hypothetical protein
MPGKKTPQSEAVMRLVQANLHLAKGSARAAIVGFEQFARRLEHETLLNPNLAENGFVAGAVAGWSAAMHEGSRLLEEAFTQWLGWSDATFAQKAFKKPRGK